MAKTTKPKNKTSEVDEKPAYVKELLEKGVAVFKGRSRGELDEMVASIPEGVNCYAGPVAYYLDKGIYCQQINLK